jgi:predicted dehydrogenase
MSTSFDRRVFLAGAASFAQIASGQDASPVGVGLVGVGNRGTSLLRSLLALPGVTVPAICDINEANLARAQALVEKAGRQRPEGYSSGVEDYRRLVSRKDLNAVIIGTPWESHTAVAVAAMQAGKYAGVEVPAALTIEECWELVNTSEKTGMPCMMLENVCYFRNVLMVLNLVRQGVLGELLHCEVGYQHFVRGSQFTKEGDLTWRGAHAAKRDGNQYPTHAIGPAAWWMNINRGDRFSYLNSMSSVSRGPNVYAVKAFGANHAAAKRTFSQGDVNTTLIKTENGLTVTLYYNTQSPRPYDLILRVQGTGGIYSGTLDKIYVDGRTPTGRSGEPAWEDTAAYFEKYEHPLWTRLNNQAASSGHGGSDYVTLHEFVKAVRNKTQTPIDVYDSATWSAILPLSVQSVASRSAPVDFPDFTKGKWRTAKPVTLG